MLSGEFTSLEEATKDVNVVADADFLANGAE
jgi:hypothetical protein